MRIMEQNWLCLIALQIAFDVSTVNLVKISCVVPEARQAMDGMNRGIINVWEWHWQAFPHCLPSRVPLEDREAVSCG